MDCRKINATFVFIIAIALSLGFVGCQHTRISLMVAVDDLGPKIATQNKYKLVGIVGGLSDLRLTEEFNYNKENSKQLAVARSILKSAQPQTFADDGIPFVIRQTGDLPQNYESLPIMIYTLFLPVISGAKEIKPNEFIVDVLDNPDARSSFKVQGRRDIAASLLPSPVPPLCFLGDASFPNEPSQCRKFTHHSLGFIADTNGVLEYGDKIGSILWSSCYINNPVAYGIAVRLKQMEDAGNIDASRNKELKDNKAITDHDFQLLEFHRKNGDGYEYVFKLKSRIGHVSIRQSNAVQNDLLTMISNDYAASFPKENRTVLGVDFKEYTLENGVINGRAQVLSLKVMALDYDKFTRTGLIRIRFAPGQMEDARKYLRRNIESVVKDKNIALLVGEEIPPTATYYLLDETVNDGILSIKFKTE